MARISEITPLQLSHALHSCSASPQGANPIGWATTSKGGAAHVHSGKEPEEVGGVLGGVRLCPI